MTVLVLRALGLGDFLTSLPALRALRRAFSSAELMLAAPPALAPLVELSGAVDRLIPAEPLGRVEVDPPDVGVNLHGRGPQSHRVLLAASPRRMIAFENAEVPASAGMPRWLPDEHEVDRWCRLLDEVGIRTVRTQLRLTTPDITPPPAAVGATLIHPGAAAAARRWPADRWALVARAELAAGRRVAVSAGPDDLELAETVVTLAGLGPDVVVSGDLLECAAAVAAARVVLCGDTGVAHLATALGTPSIVVFAQTSPGLWGPPAWHPHVAMWSARGLLDIEPEQVLAAVESLGWRSLR
jgi:ADP-heptose:LPS heptosyltransferase